MERDLQEQACWLLLAFESGLTIRIVNAILVIWCKQLGRTLQDFFAASSEEWQTTCNLQTETIAKLESAREKLVGQVFLAEQLAHDSISLITVLDEEYPGLLKLALKRNHIPPVLFYMGDLNILKRQTFAIIGSRNAGETSLTFTRDVAQYLAAHKANVISGNARGVDRAAYEGAMHAKDGHTTVVLPHGIRKLSGVQKRDLLPRIEAGNVLVMSQFAPDAQWVVSRAMDRNKVVTGLAQVVIIAESNIKGGTWDGANSALEQKRPLYVRQDTTVTVQTPAGNTQLIEKGGHPLLWPTENLDDILAPLLKESHAIRQEQDNASVRPDQLSLMIEP